MALTNVCKFEIKKELDELVKDGYSRNKAAKKLAERYSDIFETDIKPNTLRQQDKRARGIATGRPGTNVPKKERNAKSREEKKPSEISADSEKTSNDGAEAKAEVGTNVPTEKLVEIPPVLEKNFAEELTAQALLLIDLLGKAEADDLKAIPRDIVEMLRDALNTAFDGTKRAVAVDAPLANPDPRQTAENTAQEEPASSEGMDTLPAGEESPLANQAQVQDYEASIDESEEAGAAGPRKDFRGESGKRKRGRKASAPGPDAQIVDADQSRENDADINGEYLSGFKGAPIDQHDETRPFPDTSLDAEVADAETDAAQAAPEGDESSSEHPALDQESGASTDASEETKVVETPNIVEVDFGRRKRGRKAKGSAPVPDALAAAADATQDATESGNERPPSRFEDGPVDYCDAASTSPNTPDAAVAEVEAVQEAPEVGDEERPRFVDDAIDSGYAAFGEEQTANSGPDISVTPFVEAEVIRDDSEDGGTGRPSCFGDGGYPKGHPKWNCSLDRCKALNECAEAYHAKRREEEQAA